MNDTEIGTTTVLRGTYIRPVALDAAGLAIPVARLEPAVRAQMRDYYAFDLEYLPQLIRDRIADLVALEAVTLEPGTVIADVRQTGA